MPPIDPEGPHAANQKVPPDVLIVEDDPLIALDVSDVVIDLGVPSVRTAGTVEIAMLAISARAPAFALLDVRLGGDDSFTVADKLAELRVPFAFVTGYRDASMFPVRFGQCQTLTKPYSRDALLDLLIKWRELATSS